MTHSCCIIARNKYLLVELLKATVRLIREARMISDRSVTKFSSPPSLLSYIKVRFCSSFGYPKFSTMRRQDSPGTGKWVSLVTLSGKVSLKNNTAVKITLLWPLNNLRYL